MATRLFLRDAAPDNDPGELELSAALEVGTFKDFLIGVKSLSTDKGTTEVMVTGSALTQTTHQDNFFTSFSSRALEAQTITAETWTKALMVAESNGQANSFTVLSIYVFREGTGVIGYVYDSDTPLGAEWNGAARGRLATFSGSAVTAALNDYLVLEVWRHAVQSMSTGYGQDLLYDGATDVVEDASSGDAASYIETPQNLTFVVPGGPSIPIAMYHHIHHNLPT